MLDSSETKQIDHSAASALRWQRGELAEAIVKSQYARKPEMAKRYGARGHAHCLQDAHYHLEFLAEAVSVGSITLFLDYVAWAKVMLLTRNIPEEDLALNLECIRDVLVQHMSDQIDSMAVDYVEQCLRRLPDLPSERPSQIDDDMPHAALARQYVDALLKADRRRARQLILGALESGCTVEDLYMHVFRPAQHEVGRLWQMNRISVAQEHFCTAATQQIMTELYPHIFGDRRKGRTMVMACVSSELHEIGARMVADLFELHGWDTYYLGANTPTQGIVETVATHEAIVLGISCTMAFHLDRIRDIIAAVRENEETADVTILVGGYPFDVDQSLWRHMGADGNAPSAVDAVALANKLVGDHAG